MDLDQLRALDAIAAEGTLTDAAATLKVSQPTLSRAVQRLEEEIGQPLFDRAGRRMTLNEAGHTAVDWSRQILRDERLMREALELIAAQNRTLRIGTIAPAPLWRLTGLMVERFPQETLTSHSLDVQEVLKRVANGSLDLGIIADEPADIGDALRSCPLMRERLSVALPPNHPLAAKAQVTAADLDGETFLILTDIGFWRERVDRLLPHAMLIEQRDREVFTKLSRSTPYCIFVSDAPHMHGSTTGRAIVPIADDDLALAVFRLIARDDVQGLAAQLFAWVSDQAQ